MSVSIERSSVIQRISVWRSTWQQLPTITKIHWILRLAIVGEFWGHGAYGFLLGGRPQWVPYFAVVGLSSDMAYKLMPLIGFVDVFIVGCITLFFPVRIVLLYATVWGFCTALLRPLAGEGIWQFVERAYNFGIPFTLLYVSGWGHGIRSWITERVKTFLTLTKVKNLIWVLRVTIAAYLIGHGALGLFQHAPNWVNYFGVLGISADTVSRFSLISVVGAFEIILGIVVFLKPLPNLLLFVCVWKVFTEFLRLPAGEWSFELLERAGSYAAPLVLLYLMQWVHEKELQSTPEMSNAKSNPT